MAKKQPSFSDLDYDNKKKTTRKDLFLQKMNEVIPWEVLLKPIRREYPQGALGRPPIALGRCYGYTSCNNGIIWEIRRWKTCCMTARQ